MSSYKYNSRWLQDLIDCHAQELSINGFLKVQVPEGALSVHLLASPEIFSTEVWLMQHHSWSTSWPHPIILRHRLCYWTSGAILWNFRTTHPLPSLSKFYQPVYRFSYTPLDRPVDLESILWFPKQVGKLQYCTDIQREWLLKDWYLLTYMLTFSLASAAIRSPLDISNSYIAAYAAKSLVNVYPQPTPGIHSPYLYVSGKEPGSPFNLHEEDWGLQSINHLHAEASKHWIIIPPSQAFLLCQHLATYCAKIHGPCWTQPKCNQFVRHLNIYVLTKTLSQWGVRYHEVEQTAGDCIVTASGAYY